MNDMLLTPGRWQRKSSTRTAGSGTLTFYGSGPAAAAPAADREALLSLGAALVAMPR